MNKNSPRRDGNQTGKFVGAAIIGAAIGALATWLMSKKSQPLQEETKGETINKSENSKSSTVEGCNLCVICLEQEKRYLFMPCAHRALCGTCVKPYQEKINTKCPICRAKITNIIKTFDS